MGIFKKFKWTGYYSRLQKINRSYQFKLINLFFLTLLIIIDIPYAALSATESDLSLFNEIIKANTGIKSIDAEIVQYINTPEHSKEVFRGRYIADNNGRFRIDYTAPSRQIVLNNGYALYWFFPDDNILYIIGNDKKNQKELKVNPLQEFQNKEFDKQFKVTYEGKHFYGFFNTSHEFDIKDIKNELNFKIQVDAKNKTLLSKIVTNSAEQEIIKEIYGSYEKIKDIFFPARVDIYARTDKGVTKNTTEYSNIRLNYSVSDSLFQIKFPENVKKKYLQQ
jgi:outer membrane lipoprotein-sorting protein